MKLDAATLQLLILATPGLVWALIDTSVQNRGKVQQFLFTVKVLVAGLVCFAILGGIYSLVGISFDVLDFSESATFSNRLDEIGWSIPVAIFLAILTIANRTHCWLTGLLRVGNITDYSGTDDIWEFSLGFKGRHGEYVYVRDFDHNLVFFGYVLAYSDNSDVRELLLEDVEIYDLEATHLYNLDRFYVTMPCAGARVEFPSERTEQGSVKGKGRRPTGTKQQSPGQG